MKIKKTETSLKTLMKLTSLYLKWPREKEKTQITKIGNIESEFTINFTEIKRILINAMNNLLILWIKNR